MSKKFILPVLSVVVLGGGYLALTHKVYADTTNSLPPMIQKLAEHFNLNQSDVQTFMSDQRQQMQEQRQEEVKSKLDDAVTNGAITQDQENMLITKMDEMKQQRDDAKNLSFDEKRQAMQSIGDEFHTWASDNGIDLNALNLMQEHHGMHEHGFESTD